jgi:hypothetical protein
MPGKGILLALGLATAVAPPSSAPVPAPSSPRNPVFTEAAWPFLTDQWGTGRTFRCAAADCGTDVAVYLRPKIGFCDCGRGVYDDAELDRIADLDLFSPKWAPTDAGRAIEVGWMRGRVRSYYVDAAVAQRHVFTVGLNSECDAFVATVASTAPLSPGLQREALDFLNRDLVLRWARAQLGM